MTKAMMGIAFALATLAASPASAQSNQGNWWDAYHSFDQQNQQNDAYHSFAQQNRRNSPHQSLDVHNTQGRHVGTDPDPNVRDMIARDPEDEGQGW